jgi:hypothetical protein
LHIDAESDELDQGGITMIYESRRYECFPGKLPALQVMMEKMALPTFEKYGMQFIGAWSVISGEQDGTLIYLLAFDSLDDRMKKWEDFHKDEWWNAQKKATHEKEGPLVARQTTTFLKPAAYSPLK